MKFSSLDPERSRQVIRTLRKDQNLLLALSGYTGVVIFQDVIKCMYTKAVKELSAMMFPRSSKEVMNRPYSLLIKCKNNLQQIGLYHGNVNKNGRIIKPNFINKLCFYSSKASRGTPATLFPLTTESTSLAFLLFNQRHICSQPNFSQEFVKTECRKLLCSNNEFFQSFIVPKLRQGHYKLPGFLKIYYNPILQSNFNKVNRLEQLDPIRNMSNGKGSNTKHQNKQQELDNLPNEDQMNDLMYYFQEQAPKLFTPQGWSYVRCSYKVKFENRLIGTKSETLNSYILQVNVMKNITRFILYNPELYILRMTKNPLDGTIQVRWQVSGIARYIKPLAKIGLVDESESVRYIDGLSVFYMKDDGLYYKHILMKMTPMKSEEFRPVYAQIFSNFLYKPSLQPSLETNISNEIK